MDTPAFIYVVYIRTTADKVWHALTDGDMTRQYWSNHRNVSDWLVGSPWRHEDFDDPCCIEVNGRECDSNYLSPHYSCRGRYVMTMNLTP